MDGSTIMPVAGPKAKRGRGVRHDIFEIPSFRMGSYGSKIGLFVLVQNRDNVVNFVTRVA